MTGPQQKAANPDGEVPDGAVRIETRQPSRLYVALSRWLLRVEAAVRSRGSSRIRWMVRLTWVSIGTIGLILLVGPVINKPLTLEDILSSAESATDTWSARSFTADYRISQDAEGHLNAEVTETIVAFFTEDADQGAGVERVIASLYQGNDLRPTLESATVDGAPVSARITNSPLTTTFQVPVSAEKQHEITLRYTLHNLSYPTVDDATAKDVDRLSWDIFGPQWPHAVMRTELTISMPDQLNNQLVRAPTSSYAWLLVSGSKTLTPDQVDGDSRYQLTADGNTLPPNATFRFDISFEPGTVVMPERSLWFWVQLFGPVLPVLALLLTGVLSLAARAVAWSDARGAEWFVAQDQPDPDIAPPLAARIWRSILTAPLVAAVTEFQQNPSDRTRRWRLARVARHTGRLGYLGVAVRRYLAGPAWKEAFESEFRRVPYGFVRDLFIGTSLALTALQWGLARQLSYQVSVSEYWWPFAVVIVSTLLGASILAFVLSARPLTAAGARVKDHLRGLDLFITQTLSAERTTGARDPLLPYTVMFLPARRARQLVTRLTADFPRTPDPSVLSTARLLTRAGAVLSVVLPLAVMIWVPSPSASPEIDYAYSSEARGAYGVVALWRILPEAAYWSLIGLASSASLIGVFLRIRRPERVRERGLARDLVRWPPGWFTVAAFVLMLWITIDIEGYTQPLQRMLPTVLASGLLSVVSLVITAPANRPKKRRKSTKRPKKRRNKTRTTNRKGARDKTRP